MDRRDRWRPDRRVRTGEPELAEDVRVKTPAAGETVRKAPPPKPVERWAMADRYVGNRARRARGRQEEGDPAVIDLIAASTPPYRISRVRRAPPLDSGSASLSHTSYRHGVLFCAEKKGGCGSLRYQSAQKRWAHYCAAAGIDATLHQLRHTHQAELVNAGLGLVTIRKRLGHREVQTTLAQGG